MMKRLEISRVASGCPVVGIMGGQRRPLPRKLCSRVPVLSRNGVRCCSYGSAFSEACGAWDLRSLYATHRSVLRKLGFSVQGLTYPWLYFGALFATFCWHVEDHFLYSLNYLHTGAPKTWCACPSLLATGIKWHPYFCTCVAVSALLFLHFLARV